MIKELMIGLEVFSIALWMIFLISIITYHGTFPFHIRVSSLHKNRPGVKSFICFTRWKTASVKFDDKQSHPLKPT